MSGRGSIRPVRNLAAWGYESDATGSRLEVDVWTVNRRETPEDEGLPDPSDLAGGVDEVLARAGNVVKVAYAGAAGVGYQYVDLSRTNPGISSAFDATAQAFAGAARAAGGSRTGAGTFGPGAEPAVFGPDLDDVVEHGRRDVLPVVEREMPELARQLAREENRDEDEEEVEVRPFDGFRNVVRVFPKGGNVWRYKVRGSSLVSATGRDEP